MKTLLVLGVDTVSSPLDTISMIMLMVFMVVVIVGGAILYIKINPRNPKSNNSKSKP